MQRGFYQQPPNPKHAFTFAFVSIVILILPLFWSPLHDQGIGETFPLGTPTARPVTVGEVLSPPQAVQAATQVAEATPASASQEPSSSSSPQVTAPPASAQQSPLEAAVNGPTATNQDEDEANLVRPHQDPTIDFSYHLRRVVLSLLFTIVMIGLTLKLFQRYLPAFGKGKVSSGSFLNILAREPMGPTQSLALVQVGPKVLLVGLCEQSMNTLCEFTQAELEALMPTEPVAESVEMPSSQKMYGDVLRHYLSIVPGMGAKK